MMYVFAPSVETSSITRPRRRFWYDDADLEVVHDLVLEAARSTSSMYCALMPGATSTPLAPSSSFALPAVRRRVDAAVAVRAADARSIGPSAPHCAAGREDLAVEDLAAERAVVDVHRDRLVEAAPVARRSSSGLPSSSRRAGRCAAPVARERHRVRAELLAGQRIDRVAAGTSA